MLICALPWPGLPPCCLASSWGLCPLARRDPAYTLSLHLNMLFILQIFILFLGNGRAARKKAFIQLTLVNPAPFSWRRLMGYQSVGWHRCLARRVHKRGRGITMTILESPSWWIFGESIRNPAIRIRLDSSAPAFTYVTFLLWIYWGLYEEAIGHFFLLLAHTSLASQTWLNHRAAADITTEFSTPAIPKSW